jgi:hypothetical protein
VQANSSVHVAKKEHPPRAEFMLYNKEMRGDYMPRGAEAIRRDNCDHIPASPLSQATPAASSARRIGASCVS